MKKELTLEEPFLKTYLGDAYTFSMLGREPIDSGGILDEYIHLQFRADHGMLKYRNFDYYDFLPSKNAFIKKYYVIPKRICSPEKIFNRIVKMIDSEEYFFGFWNENKYRLTIGEDVEDVLSFHGVFVCGYDDVEKDLFVLGFYGGEFVKRKVPIAIFYEALCFETEYVDTLAFTGYRVSKYHKWEYNIDVILRELVDYKIAGGYDEEKQSFYDIPAEEEFVKLLTSLVVDGSLLHIPSIYCMVEHKSLMVNRLGFLLKKGVRLPYECIALYEELKERLVSVLVQSIKYNLTRKCEYGQKIIREMTKIIDKEVLATKLLETWIKNILK